MAKKCAVGGQAVIEGVLMKNDSKVAIAVRQPNNKIHLKKQRVIPWAKKWKFLGWPFVRGPVQLIEMLVIGMKALNYSANASLGEEEEQISDKYLALTAIIAAIVAIALFKLLPLGVTSALYRFKLIDNTISFNLIDGVIRITLFILYILAISLMSDVKRLFQYHGAEHKAVHCYEDGKKLTVANVRKYTTVHPRCGTSFLFIVLIIAILVFSVVDIDLPFWLLFFYRIPLLIPISAIAYEVLKLTSRFKTNILMRIIMAPGSWIQKLTTKEPDKKQIEVAIKALNAVLGR
ncbi:DUF1385 domain-containing protein [Nanoarchaeota archaeon]